MTESRTFKAGILASGQALSTVGGLIIYAVLSRVLSKQDYATYRQTLLAYTFAAPILMLGLPHALYYFLPGEKERARGVLLENLLLLGVMGAVFSLFLLLGGNRLLAWRFNNPALKETLLILAPYPLFMLPAAALSACLMARDRARQVAFFNVLSRVAALIIIIGATLVWRTPGAAVVGAVVAAAVVLLPALSLMLGSTRGSGGIPTAPGMWSQMRYSVPLGLAGMFGAIQVSLDKIIVSSMCRPEDFAVYANGAMQIPLVTIITGSATAVLLPDMARLYKAGSGQEALLLWKRAAAKCAMLILPAMCLLFVMAPQFVTVLYGPRYLNSVLPFRCYLLLLPIGTVAFGAAIMAAGKSHLILVRSVISLVINLVASVVLVHFFGYIGAIIGTIIALYVFSVPFNLVVIGRVSSTSPARAMPFLKYAVIFLISAAGCVVLLPLRWFPIRSNVVRLLVYVPLYADVVVLLFAWAGLLDLKVLEGWLRRSWGRLVKRRSSE